MITHSVLTTQDKPWQEGRLDGTNTRLRGVLNLTGEPMQAWHGFGGCFNELGWIALGGKVSDADRAAVMHDLFSPEGALRLNLARLPIGANDYAETWYSLNETDGDTAMEHFSIERDFKYLIPYIRSALALNPEIELFASPWSPPSWMKTPKSYNFGKLVWTPEILNAYALYFLKFVRAYRAAGIDIAQVHVQNEPDSDQKFPSHCFSAERMRDFIRDHLGPCFEQASEKAAIWLGTIERPDYNTWIHPVLRDEAARRFIAGVGFQWAGKAAVQRTHEAWPDLPLMQTENECGDGQNSWDYAHYIFDLVRHYLGNGVSRYCYWNMVLAPGGVSTWGWKQNALITADPATGQITRNPEFHVFRHMAQFVQPGGHVMRLSGDLCGNALAFANPRGGSTVVVIQNPFTEPLGVELSVAGRKELFTLPSRSFQTLVL
ncbi:MAG: glycosyl hydrolase [Verrucomicrobiota bacterium]|nr:glycosyl hydrolase [Verrucomicrobiota bacterium]